MNMRFEVQAIEVERTGPDIIRLRLQRPVPFPFTPGNAVLIGIPGSDNDPAPFSPVNGPLDLYLEFFIKIYRSHDGITKELEQITEGDTLQISEPFGSIDYDGPGYFLAAGTGITPFLAIFRQLHAEGNIDGNHLFYTETNRAEVIQEREFREMLGNRVEILLTEEDGRRLDSEFLRQRIGDADNSRLYICGPPDFVEDMRNTAKKLGIPENNLVFEKEA